MLGLSFCLLFCVSSCIILTINGWLIHCLAMVIIIMVVIIVTITAISYNYNFNDDYIFIILTFVSSHTGLRLVHFGVGNKKAM
jgi:hypothetical protein